MLKHDALRWLLLGIPSLGRQCHLRSLGLKLMYSAAHNAACCCCCKINRQWPFGGPRSEVCSEGVDEDPPPPPPPSPAKSPSIKNWSTLSKKMIPLLRSFTTSYLFRMCPIALSALKHNNTDIQL